MRGITDAIKHLLIINVLFFIATQTLGDQMFQWFALWFPQNENFGFWQVLTHMFMHGGLMHIVFNMYALWAFGTPLERKWGSKKFLFFYISAGLGAALLHTGINYYYLNEGMNAILTTGITEREVIDIISAGKYMPDWYNVASESTIDNFVGAFSAPTCAITFRFIFWRYRIRDIWSGDRSFCAYWWCDCRLYYDVVLENK